MRGRRESRFRSFAAKLRGFVGGQRDGDEFDAEIQEHVRLLADRFVAQGMSREEAALAARRQFGNTTLLQEDRRALQTLPSVEAWGHDLRYALRTLWRSPGFAIVSIVTLALGIGAAAAIYSVIHNVMLAPFPYRDANRMVFPRIYDARQGPEIGRQGYAAAEVLEFVEHSHVFEATTAALGEGGVLYRHRTGTEALNGAPSNLERSLSRFRAWPFLRRSRNHHAPAFTRRAEPSSDQPPPRGARVTPTPWLRREETAR